MKNLSKDKELEGTIPPGFFVGCPEQEFYLEMGKNKVNKIEEYVNG